jgi:hypothetical protein
MNFFYFALGFLFCGLLFESLKVFSIKQSFIIVERQFLLGAMYLIQFKYHAIQVLELAYEEAAESHPEKREEGKLVVSKIHEKFNEFGNTWVTNFIKLLPYKTQYNDWNSAIQYVEKLLNEGKKI